MSTVNPVRRYVLQKRIERAKSWADISSHLERAPCETEMHLLLEQEGVGDGLRIICRDTTIVRETRRLS